MVLPAKNPEIVMMVGPAVSTFDHVVDLEDDGRTASHSASVAVSRQDSSARPVPQRAVGRPGTCHPVDPAMTPEYDQRGAVTGEPMPAQTERMAAAMASSRERARRPPWDCLLSFPLPAGS